MNRADPLYTYPYSNMIHNPYYSHNTYIPNVKLSNKDPLHLSSNEWTSIYIPYIDSSYTREYLAHIFEHKYCIGKVKQIDLVRNPSKRNKRKDDYSAFIHFEYWFNNDFSVFLRYYLNKHTKYDITNYYRYFQHHKSQLEHDQFYIMINHSNKYAATPTLSTSLSSDENDSYMNCIPTYQSPGTSPSYHNEFSIILDKHHKRIELLEDEISALKRIIHTHK
jgi:hypothetical protein